jgi:hypothetical protein
MARGAILSCLRSSGRRPWLRAARTADRAVRPAALAPDGAIGIAAPAVRIAAPAVLAPDRAVWTADRAIGTAARVGLARPPAVSPAACPVLAFTRTGGAVDRAVA